MKLISGGKDGKGKGAQPPQEPPEPPEFEYEFNPSAEGLAIEIPPRHRSRAILARQQARRDVDIAEEQALYLRLRGYTVLEISKELECSTTHVRTLIKRASDRRKPELDRTLQEYVEEQLMQIEHLMSVYMKIPYDETAALTIPKLLERKAKLLGLDKPVKHEIVPTAAPLESDIDPSLLSVDELKQLRALVAAAMERKARLPIEGTAQVLLEHEE